MSGFMVNQALIQIFKNSLQWTVFETLLYQAIFFIHHSALFHFCTPVLYGRIGVIFATIFTIIPLLLVGLDLAYIFLFKPYSQNKTDFRYLLFYHMIPASICSGIIILMVLLVVYLNFFSLPLSFFQSILIGLYVWIEVTKKIARSFLQTAFKTKKTALLEIATLSIYVTTVWVRYGITKSLSLNIILNHLIVCTTISAIILWYWLYVYYHALPIKTDIIYQEKKKTLWLKRVYTAINQISHLACSGNMIVMLVAFHYDTVLAGSIHVLNMVVYTTTKCFQKVFGPPYQGLFAHMYMQPENIRFLSMKIVQKSIASIILSTIFLSVVCMIYRGIYQQHIVLIVLSLCVIYSIESIIMIYEKVLTSQNNIQRMAILSCTHAAISSLFWFIKPSSCIILVISLSVIRITVCFLYSRLVRLSISSDNKDSVIPIHKTIRNTSMKIHLNERF